MITFDIDNKEYKLEFGFDAAENKDIVQKMFDYMTGAYIYKENGNTITAMSNGAGKMVADYSEVCHMAFYAGCLQHNSVTKAEAKALTRAYITQKRKTDSKYGYYQLFEDIKIAMADDGFFELSGLAQTVEEMNKSAAEQLEKIQKEKSKK
jgi:hypothetical protein